MSWYSNSSSSASVWQESGVPRCLGNITWVTERDGGFTICRIDDVTVCHDDVIIHILVKLLAVSLAARIPQVSIFSCVLRRQTERNLSGREAGTMTHRWESWVIMSANMSLAARVAGFSDLVNMVRVS